MQLSTTRILLFFPLLLLLLLLLLFVSPALGVVDDDMTPTAASSSSSFPEAPVLNSLLADLWPLIGNDLLKQLRTQPLLLDPFLLQLQPGSRFERAPRIERLRLVGAEGRVSNATTTPGGTHFHCRISYHGQPELHFLLTGADVWQYNRTNKTTTTTTPGPTKPATHLPRPTQRRRRRFWRAGQLFVKRVLRQLVPDIGVEFNSIRLEANVSVRLDLLTTTPTLEFYFVDRPDMEWDLEFSVMELPLWGEDSLDQILTARAGGSRASPSGPLVLRQ
mmetsp:Transcript_6887/g.19288  ORF Transcript_6887/g.19288 Transcript_6887/m.19288 type:complete len:276 (+) Transcript_6887:33-860(+)